MNSKRSIIFSFSLFLLAVSVLITPQAICQEDSENQDKKENNSPVINHVFTGPSLINLVTTEQASKNHLYFFITHRFGNVGGSGGGYHTMWGVYQSRDIRMALTYGVTDRIEIGLGKSKMNELVDGTLKIKLLQQREDFSIPVSASWYSSAGLTTKSINDTNYTKFAHRMNYVHSLLISGKLHERLSFEVAPSVIHRNIIYEEINPDNNSADQNTFASLGLGGKLRVTKVLSVIVDYFYSFSKYRLDNPERPFYAPLGVGVELNTGGHVFNINLTNSPGIVPNNFVYDTPETWSDGGMKMGFTISRKFKL